MRLELKQARSADPRALAESAAALSRAEARERALAARVVELEGQDASAQAEAKAAAKRHAEEAAAQKAKLAARAADTTERDALIAARDAALAEVARLGARVSELDARLRARQADEARGAEGVAGDLAAAEAALRERAREIAALKREIENRGDMVRELVAQVSAFTGSDGLGARGG